MEDKSRPEVAVERAMLAIRRRQSRRTFAAESATNAPAVTPAVVEVLIAVEDDEAAGQTTSVTGLAGRLGVDQPRASKLVAQAVSGGLLLRAADQTDGRRSLLGLTAAGRDCLAQTHQFRQRAFGSAMSSWTERERRTFARLLTRFINDLG